MRSADMLVAALMAYGLGAGQQASPGEFALFEQPLSPPMVHYRHPADAVISGVYKCPDAEVRFEISAHSGILTVNKYAGAAGEASEDNLRKWSASLSGFATISSVEVLCQAGKEEMIIISGPSKDARKVNYPVKVYWSSGRMGILH